MLREFDFTINKQIENKSNFIEVETKSLKQSINKQNKTKMTTRKQNFKKTIQ